MVEWDVFGYFRVWVLSFEECWKLIMIIPNNCNEKSISKVSLQIIVIIII